MKGKEIEKGESEDLEFKETPKLDNEIGEAASAFSNTDGGKILVGISDFGRILGLTIGKNTIENIAGYIKRNTDPKIYPSIKVEEIKGKKIIIIKVLESKEKPVFFKNHAYKRIGKTNQELTSAEIRKLAKESGERVYWDSRVCEEASLKDIDWKFVNETFLALYEDVVGKKVTGKIEDVLKSLNCIKNQKPTNAGILLFGDAPQKFFPNSFIALVRYKGDKISTERLDYKEFDGNLFQQIDNCDKYIKDHMAVMSRLHPNRVRREDISEYGTFSIRELITNSVCHRDYSNQGSKIIIKIFSDRIEFFNPGGLLKGITPENIVKEQYSRNPIIARVLSKVRYIEEVGEGWDKIIKEYEEHPLHPEMPKIDSSKNSIIVTLFSTQDKFKKEKLPRINDRQKKALKYVEEHTTITNKDYKRLFPEITSRTALNDLNDLVNKKLLKKKGKTKGTYYIIPK